MFAEQIVVEQSPLSGDFSPSGLLRGVVRRLDGRVEFVVGDVIYSIDLTCTAGDCSETAWQRFSRNSD